MSKHVGHSYFTNKQERVKYFFEQIQRNNTNSYRDVQLHSMSNDIHSFGAHLRTDFVNLQEFFNKPRLRGFQDSKYYIIKQHYPMVALFNRDIQSMDMDIIFNHVSKVFRDISTKTNCFSILFVNPSIFTALRHYFINGYSMTCNNFAFIFDKNIKRYDSKNLDVYKEINSVTIKEYQRFPKDKKEKIERKYSMNYDKILSLFNENYNGLDKFHDLFLNNTSFLWDVNWYLSEDDTANNIKKIYDILEFDDYDDTLIREMYQCWIEYLSQYVSKWREYDNNENPILDKIHAFNEDVWDALKFEARQNNNSKI